MKHKGEFGFPDVRSGLRWLLGKVTGTVGGIGWLLWNVQWLPPPGVLVIVVSTQ